MLPPINLKNLDENIQGSKKHIFFYKKYLHPSNDESIKTIIKWQARYVYLSRLYECKYLK